MRNIFIVLLFVIISNTLSAQAFAKDTVHVNFGLGLGWPYKFEKIYDDIWSVPALTVSIERGFFAFDSVGSVSLGLSGSYKYLQCNRQSKTATWNNIVVGAMARFNLYYFNDKKFIPYVGVFGGINAIKFQDPYYNSSNDYPTNYNGVYPLAYIFAGGKYISTPTFGMYAEISYGFSYLTFGIYKVL